MLWVLWLNLEPAGGHEQGCIAHEHGCIAHYIFFTARAALFVMLIVTPVHPHLVLLG